MAKIKCIIIIWVIIGINCCKIAEPLTLPKATHFGSIYTQGYYYNQVFDNDGTLFETFFLYKNGHVYFLSVNAKDFKELELKMSDRALRENDQKLYYVWGVFNMYKSEIWFEYWLPGSGGPYPVKLNQGKILNDSTIVIGGLTKVKINDYEPIDTFRFRPLDIKPDSITSFLK